MNRNLAGEWLSREELIDLCVEAGTVERHKITRDMKTGVFHSLSRDIRWKKFWAGELILDTRPDERKPLEPLVIDWETLAFMGVTPL